MTFNDMPSHHGMPESAQIDHPNETIKLLLKRASCRSFTGEPIDPEILHTILDAGTHAATGGNLQPYSIIQIEDHDKRQELARLCMQDFIGVAPTLLMFCIDLHRLERWARLEKAPFTARSSFPTFWIAFQDTIISAQSMCTAADSLGVGSVYIGTVMDFFLEIAEMLKLPKGVFPVVLVCLGMPQSKAAPRKKLPTSVVVHRETYHEMSDEELEAAFENKYPGQRVEITPERMRTMETVCRTVHGEAYAGACLERIKEYGYIRPVHRYFGLHYRADEMVKYNREFVSALEEMGFHILGDYQPEQE